MNQRLRLIGDRRRQSSVRVPEDDHADAGDEVEIVASRLVVQMSALTADEDHGQSLVGLKHVFGFERFDLFCSCAHFRLAVATS